MNATPLNFSLGEKSNHNNMMHCTSNPHSLWDPLKHLLACESVAVDMPALFQQDNCRAQSGASNFLVCCSMSGQSASA